MGFGIPGGPGINRSLDMDRRLYLSFWGVKRYRGFSTGPGVSAPNPLSCLRVNCILIGEWSSQGSKTSTFPFSHHSPTRTSSLIYSFSPPVCLDPHFPFYNLETLSLKICPLRPLLSETTLTLSSQTPFFSFLKYPVPLRLSFFLLPFMRSLLASLPCLAFSLLSLVLSTLSMGPLLGAEAPSELQSFRLPSHPLSAHLCYRCKCTL